MADLWLRDTDRDELIRDIADAVDQLVVGVCDAFAGNRELCGQRPVQHIAEVDQAGYRLSAEAVRLAGNQHVTAVRVVVDQLLPE